MDRSATAFWGLIAVLLAASAFYAHGANQQRRHVSSSTIENGDLVRLVQVVDGDSVVVAREGQEPVTVRLVGIKSFDAKVERDATTPFARGAVEQMRRYLTDRPLRVMLAGRDRHDRFLATLYVEDQDVALRLVSEGLVLVYTAYPFAQMPFYLQAQDQARAARRGLWVDRVATERAQAMMREWQTK